MLIIDKVSETGPLKTLDMTCKSDQLAHAFLGAESHLKYSEP